MADVDRILHRLVEEGTSAAQRPSVDQLRRRVGRRRARRRFAGAALAVAILAGPATWFTHSGTGSQPVTPGAAASANASATTVPTVLPPLTPQQKALMAQQAGSLTVEPASVVAGGEVTVSGKGCAPGGAVSLNFGPSIGTGIEATVHAGPDGSFTGSVTVSAAAGSGAQRVWAQCMASAGSSPTSQHGAVYVFAP